MTAIPSAVPAFEEAAPAAVILVSCVKQKLDQPRPARDLYISDWFRKARAFVEDSGLPWFILSAEHGLLEPGTMVVPYERTLIRMPAPERRAWGRRVADQLRARLPAPPARAIFLAGALYREALAEWAGASMEVPMAGLGIGEQKAWLVRNRPSIWGMGI